MIKPVRKKGRGYWAITQPSYSKLRKAITAKWLRENIGHSRVIARFGYSGDVPHVNNPIIINSLEGIKTAKDKLKTNRVLSELGLPSSEFFRGTEIPSVIKYPLYAKPRFGSRGIGLKFIENQEELEQFLPTINRSRYIFEERCNYVREYGVHVSSLNGIYHSVRKMLKSDAENRWFRNSNNCVFFLEENEHFSKPECWDEIEAACLKFLKFTGLDIGRFDIKVNRNGTRFNIIEVNSSPSINSEIIYEKYLKEVKSIICAE